MPWSEGIVNPKSYFETSFANKKDEERKRESSISNDDFSIACDELLEELDADLQDYKFSQKLVTSNTKSFTESDDDRSQEEHYAKKIKKVELSDIYDKVDDLQVGSESRYYKPHTNNAHMRSHEEYFDNL